MRKKSNFHSIVIVSIGSMALAACWYLWTSEPPEATPEQIAREQSFLRARFFQDACFAPMFEAAKATSTKLEDGASYSVDLPVNAMVHDGYLYALEVRKSDRAGFLTRSGGYFGVYETLGPLPLAKCLREVF